MDRPVSSVWGKGKLCVWAWSIAGLALVVPSALAHQVRVSAHARGEMIHGQVKLGSGAAAEGATVTAFDSAGRQIGRTTTDGQGEFSIRARSRCDHRLVIDTGDGHGAEYLVPAAQLSESLPPGGGLEAIHNRLIRLQQRLDEYEQKIRLRDVLGGIGYIVGIAGIAFYFLGVRRRRAGSSNS